VPESRFQNDLTRPTGCPFCKGKNIDTLAKVITETSAWRCRECEGTWTLRSQRAVKK